MKLTITLLFALVLALGASAQYTPTPFFKHVAGVSRVAPGKLGLASDSTMNTIRPVVNIASYGIPGNILLTGAGAAYEHLKWNTSTSTWNVVWSVNALGWYQSNLTTSGTGAFAYGLAVGFLNNLVMVGGAYNGKNAIATVGIGINLN